jgi:hypothetical protein
LEEKKKVAEKKIIKMSQFSNTPFDKKKELAEITN